MQRFLSLMAFKLGFILALQFTMRKAVKRAK